MTAVSFLDGRVTLYPGDCLDVLASLPENSVDSVVCDPPYHLTSIVRRFGGDGAAEAKVGATGAFKRTSAGFMGKQWDGGDIAFRIDTWQAVQRVLKPGGYILAFSGTRTYHRMVCAIEDAGFEIRDQIGWCYASGFPKSLNVGKKLSGIRCSCERPERTGSVLQHDMRCVQPADVPAQEPVEPAGSEILLQSLPEHDLPGPMLRPQSEEGGARREEQVVEGRRHAPQEAGKLRFGKVRPLPGSPAVNGADGRLCDGASEGDGGVDRSPAAAGGVRPSRRSQAAEQCPPQSGTLAGQSQPQNGGAWPHCGRCGKPIVPDGLGTALKPAWEPICVARKPLIGTVAENVLAHGVGALNIDGCRVGDEGGGTRCGNRSPDGKCLGHPDRSGTAYGLTYHAAEVEGDLGRWPANLILDGSDEVLAAFPDVDGQIGGNNDPNGSMGYHGGAGGVSRPGIKDSGSAARFFYSSKADADDRVGSKHPTVKPVDLMQYLCRLVTPPGGTVLDPFAGTGTTGEAAWREGFNAILIEREPEYQADIARRMDLVLKPTKRAAVAKTKNKLQGAEGTPLFGGEAA